MASHSEADRNGQATRASRQEPRSAPVIRVAVRVETLEAVIRPEDPFGLPCSGRCGHCDLHPCRLHGVV